MNAIASQEDGFFFLDAPGGSGKIFLILLILLEIRLKGNIAKAIFALLGITLTFFIEWWKNSSNFHRIFKQM